MFRKRINLSRRSKFSASLIAVALLLATVIPAFAVTFGVPDGEDHPYVGLMVFDVDGSPSHRCTGTLLSPTVMLTAGHCTFGTSGGRVWFETDVEAGIPGNGYPSGGGTSIEFSEIHTHPDYNDGAFYLFDVGIAILSQPVDLDTYGTLADIGTLDSLKTKRGLQDQSFTVVGYGLQSVKPTLEQDRVRYRGTVNLIDVSGTGGIPKGTSVLLTNNPGKHATGGTCFGDSGGPTFWGDTNIIVAVTSFGLNQNCKGIGGGYRIDTADDQEFINSFLE
jgi:hypothetical protein